MYSFAQRSDTQVFDEPLYAFYLKNGNAIDYHPGASEILKDMENSGEKVVQMMLGQHTKPVVFFKHMTHHLLDLNRDFLQETHNIILTRDPKEMLPSFAKVIDKPSMKDVGYSDHIELLKHLEAKGEKPLVLEAETVLRNPERILKKLCAALAIPFDTGMLQWVAGPRSEDGVWAPYWYTNVHKSTGFQKYIPKTEPFPDHLLPLYEACLPHYLQLKELALH